MTNGSPICIQIGNCGSFLDIQQSVSASEPSKFALSPNYESRMNESVTVFAMAKPRLKVSHEDPLIINQNARRR